MRTKKKTKAINITAFIIIVLIIGISSFLGVKGLTIGAYRIQSFGEVLNRGLDLQGGVSILEEVSVKGKTSDKDILDLVTRTKQVLELRVNSMGVGEIPITSEGKNRIRIEVPGKFDSNDIAQTLTKQGKLTFVGPDGTEVITGSDVKSATPVFEQNTNKPEISLELNSSGKQKFADATKKYMGQAISIKMDEDVITSPTVQAEILDGKASITNMKSAAEAKRIAGIIQSGALPATLTNVETKVVGPTIGEKAIPLSLLAAEVGLGIVLLFMIAYYRVPGIIADMALVIYIILMLLAFKIFKVTLTLPGIAGLLLTIGMAVDANVLIFERIKEELRTGKSVNNAVHAGFHRAMSSILDSQLTTIIAGVVLYWLGSGSVKGFALTLVIGCILSMFTAITITREIIKVVLNTGMLNKLSHFGVKRG